jgi:phosphoribosyl 1,2-cyclic phosphodiesterase
MSLRVRFWGTRGSIPTPGPTTVRYGGNTPCLEVRTANDWLVILDAGTGIRELGRTLLAQADGRPVEGDIFLSHAHWDHIQGIPFFAPLFKPGNRFTVWGAKSLQTSIDRVLRDQMSPVVFPVRFDELAARIEFRELEEEHRRGNGYWVEAFEVHHPGGALGYRFTSSGDQSGGLVYVPDNELALGAANGERPGWREGLVAFAKGARVLVHDATFSAAEYEQFRGWGHSTDSEAVALALDAGVERLVLFHHRPERTDDEVDARVESCRREVARLGSRLEVVAAAEGMQLEV